jgi:hypothetical protein
MRDLLIEAQSGKPAPRQMHAQLLDQRARNVANATGIAVGLLKGDELVYRAGSGIGVTYVGQHVMATLCASTHNASTREILRVENVQTDRRIEAAICRQFGVHSCSSCRFITIVLSVLTVSAEIICCFNNA